MAQLILCPHCSAPHRVVAAQDQFVCDYCRGLVEVGSRRSTAELIAPYEPDPTAARRAARRWLLRKGALWTRVHVGQGRMVPYWQIISGQGEEHLLCGEPDAGLLERSLQIPAIALVRRDEAPRGAGLLLTPPAVSAQQAVDAALASFSSDEVESVRLIWLPVVPLRLSSGMDETQALFVAGAEKVVARPLPSTAVEAPPEPALLWAFLLYLASAVMVGMLNARLLDRILAELLLLGVAAVVWRLPPLARSQLRGQWP